MKIYVTGEVILYDKSTQEGLTRLWEWNGIETDLAMFHIEGAKREVLSNEWSQSDEGYSSHSFPIGIFFLS